MDEMRKRARASGRVREKEWTNDRHTFLLGGKEKTQTNERGVMRFIEFFANSLARLCETEESRKKSESSKLGKNKEKCC